MIDALLTRDLGAAAETLIAVTVLLLAVLLVRQPVARHFGAGTAYLLWLLPAARLVLPPLPAPLAVFSVAPLVGSDTAAGGGLGAALGRAVPDRLAADIQGSDAFAGIAQFTSRPVAAGLDLDLAAVLPAGLGLAWAAIAATLITRGLIAHARFMRLVETHAQPASPGLLTLAGAVARRARLRRTPRIVLSLLSGSPFVTGLLRPVVVLPAWFETDFEETDARAALAHEFTHLRRGDLWALQAANMLVASLWFNPLAYVAARAFRTDQEAACDADVLHDGHASPHAYGTTLLKAVRHTRPERLTLAASLPLTHALKERLMRMAYPAPSARRRAAGAALIAALGLGGLAGTASLATADAGEHIRIDDGQIWIDGARVSDRQMVMLGDPFAGTEVSPETEAAIERLGVELERTASAHEWRTDEMSRAFPSDADDAEAEARIAAWQAAFEAETTAFDARMENLSAELDALVEASYGLAFNAKIEAASGLAHDLTMDCARADLAPGETRIIARQNPDGTPFRLACVDGPRDALDGAAIAHSTDLTAAEQGAFRAYAEGRDGGAHFVFNGPVDLPGRIEPPEPPEPPAPPSPCAVQPAPCTR